VFVHQDGIILSATLWALAELGILEASLTRERTVADLYPAITPAGFAYLRVGLRCLASQGWLEAPPTGEPGTTTVRWSAAGRAAAGYFDRYVAAGRFLAGFHRRDDEAWTGAWDSEQVASLIELIELRGDRWGLGPELAPDLRALVTTHLDATLVVPAMLWLRETGGIGEEGPTLADDELGEAIGRVLASVGWIDDDAAAGGWTAAGRASAGGAWTPAGHQAATLAVHFGMAASYLPMLARLPELFSGEATVTPAPGAGEWHVNRRLNVVASATAHKRYFTDADELFVELFNREPVSEQPRFVADMGCGDGSWLVHLYELIMRRTLRGQLAEEWPLLMVGIDYNLPALAQARLLLAASNIPALLIQGDVGDPDEVARSLAGHGLAMTDGLHIRAFIDHNRGYRGADTDTVVSAVSSGAYVGPRGTALEASAVEGDLVGHLRRWAPHVAKHGLVLLEAHCVDPVVARRHLGATHSVAFDGYHGYSHQYPVEHAGFVNCCRLAGLRLVSEWERRYPASRPFVAVTLSRLVAAEAETSLPAPSAGLDRTDGWVPPADTELGDGMALHELLYVDGDLNHPRSWCSAATGYVVAGALAVVEARLADARRGEVIRVLDYGAGTGLASIEFLKACRERGIDQRLERLGASLEMHLVDLPSSWFAFGFELLRDCQWARFHSLSGGGRRFRPMLEVTGGTKMDVVMSNMVFHLVPPRALESMAAGLASVTVPGGCLVWSAPDIGPAGPFAVLFHDSNRALRRRWLQFLDGEDDDDLFAAAASPHLRALRDGTRGIRDSLNDADKRDARARANRRVLPEPNVAQRLVDALAGHFRGQAELRFETHELLVKDVIDTLLVPANQTEYLPEIADRAIREGVIREVMANDVLPVLRTQGAGTAGGLNVQWTLGKVWQHAERAG
jgi:SAM-dependent methyltransferase